MDESQMTNEDIRQRCNACGRVQHVGWALTNDAWKRLGLDAQKAYCIECAASLTSESFSLSEIAFLSFNDTILIDTMPGTQEAAESQRDALTSLAKKAIDWTKPNVDSRKSQPDDNSELTTVDVPASELRMGDTVVGVMGRNGFMAYERAWLTRYMSMGLVLDGGDLGCMVPVEMTVTYRVRLPRPEVVNRCPGCGCVRCTDGCTWCEPKCPRISVTASSEAARRDGA